MKNEEDKDVAERRKKRKKRKRHEERETEKERLINQLKIRQHGEKLVKCATLTNEIMRMEM